MCKSLHDKKLFKPNIERNMHIIQINISQNSKKSRNIVVKFRLFQFKNIERNMRIIQINISQNSKKSRNIVVKFRLF